MTHQTIMQSDCSENQEIQLARIDETMLPKLIQGQIGKLNELDEGVKTALAAAEHAEGRALSARKLSAGWSLLEGKKKEAIEGLQEAGIELAGAVQLGAKAQKLSFEFQQRLAEVTKYLFGLGVGNIAANRAVVRELELRLSGASEEQLSDLARQEVASVVRQLNEQEDLLRKQDQMKGALRELDAKIKHLLDQTDDLANSITAVDKASEAHKHEISALHQQVLTHRAGLETLTAGIAEMSSHAEQANRNLLARTEDMEIRLKEQADQHQALANNIYFMVQASQQQQQAIVTLQQQVLAQQAGLAKLATSLAQSRSVLNVRTALMLMLATALSAATYFLR